MRRRYFTRTSPKNDPWRDTPLSWSKRLPVTLWFTRSSTGIKTKLSWDLILRELKNRFCVRPSKFPSNQVRERNSFVRRQRTSFERESIALIKVSHSCRPYEPHENDS